jgi:hypothetical protein
VVVNGTAVDMNLGSDDDASESLEEAEGELEYYYGEEVLGSSKHGDEEEKFQLEKK